MSTIQSALFTVATNRPLFAVKIALLTIGLAAAALGVETGIAFACAGGDDGGSCE